jgi:hypothetical protein
MLQWCMVNKMSLLLSLPAVGARHALWQRIRASQEPLTVIGLFLLLFFLRLPSLQLPFEPDSGAIAYHARLIVNGEPLYGSHHPAHHVPGVFYLYAAAFKLFGDSFLAVRLLLLLWTTGTVYLIYRVGILIADRLTGIVAALLAAMLFSHLGFSGAHAKIEAFVSLPQLAAVFTLLHLAKHQAKPWRYLFIGLWSAGAFLLKPNYVSPLILTAVFLAAELWQNKTKAGLRQFFARGFWIGVGFIAVLTPVMAYFTGVGLLPRFLLVFVYGQSYADLRFAGANSQYLVLRPLAVLGYNNALILITALATLVFMGKAALTDSLRKNHAGVQMNRSGAVGYIVIWFALAFLETGISRTYFLYYYMVFIPPLSLLAALFWRQLYKDAQKHTAAKYSLLAPALLLCLLLFTFSIHMAKHFPYHYHHTRYLLGRESYAEFLTSGLPHGEGDTITGLQDVTRHIQDNTEPADTIYVWTGDIQLYYMAERRSPLSLIWPMYHQAEANFQERIFQAAYIIVHKDILPIGISETPAWFERGLKEKYELDVVLHNRLLYRRVP